jgi:hypothetical protein
LQVLNVKQVHEWFARSPESGADAARHDGRNLLFAHPEVDCIDLEYLAGTSTPSLEMRVSVLYETAQQHS